MENCIHGYDEQEYCEECDKLNNPHDFQAEKPVKHTPGPWNIADIENREESFVILTEDKRVIGWTANSFNDDMGEYVSEENKANARLIAAAPDLLKVCEEALHLMDVKPFHTDGSRIVQHNLRQAIAKAEKGPE